MKAALRVPAPSSTRAPATSWITAAYQPGGPGGDRAAAVRAAEVLCRRL